MIDLKNIKHIYLYPGKTDFRNGITGLRMLIGNNIEKHSLYVFCNYSCTQLKLLEVEDNAIWLYQKKLLHKRFMYPTAGDTTLLTVEQIKAIIEGVSLISQIEGIKSVANKDIF